MALSFACVAANSKHKQDSEKKEKKEKNAHDNNKKKNDYNNKDKYKDKDKNNSPAGQPVQNIARKMVGSYFDITTSEKPKATIKRTEQPKNTKGKHNEQLMK